MTPTKPHPRSRRKAHEIPPAKPLDTIIGEKQAALMASMVLVQRWRPGQFDIARLRLLWADLRRAEVEVETLVELSEKKRRQGV